MSKETKCKRCGEPMPQGEEMFYCHGYRGPCPKPPLDETKSVLGSELLSPKQQQAILDLLRERRLEIYINANDVFVPGADAVEVETIERLQDYLNSYAKGGYEECVVLMKKLNATPL